MDANPMKTAQLQLKLALGGFVLTLVLLAFVKPVFSGNANVSPAPHIQPTAQLAAADSLATNTP